VAYFLGSRLTVTITGRNSSTKQTTKRKEYFLRNKENFHASSRCQRHATNILDVKISFSLNRQVKSGCVKRGKFIPVNAIIAYGGEEVQLHLFLNLSLHGGEWSASQHGRLTKENECLIIVN
jgi:hypothetical protein